jgi:bifunctional non-homologous end joining protein LigD
MLARSAPLPDAPASNWVLEVKWDGIRAQLRVDHGSLTLRTRPGRDATAEFPELARLAEALGSHRMVLDGELVCLDRDGRPDFGAIATRLGRRRRPADRPVVMQVFDVLHLDGEPVRTLPYQQRRELLARLADEVPSEVARVPRTFALDEDLLGVTLAMELEGVVAKRLDAPYRPGRRDGTWIKHKHRRSERVAIVGWRERTGAPDELLIADLDGRPRGWCAFGLPGEARRRVAEDARRRGRERRGAWIAPAPLMFVDVAHHGRVGGRLRDPILRATGGAGGASRGGLGAALPTRAAELK